MVGQPLIIRKYFRNRKVWCVRVCTCVCICVCVRELSAFLVPCVRLITTLGNNILASDEDAVFSGRSFLQRRFHAVMAYDRLRRTRGRNGGGGAEYRRSRTRRDLDADDSRGD